MKNFFRLVLMLFLLVISINVASQDVITLWKGQKKPFYKDNQVKEYEKEAWGVSCVYNVTEPTLTVYKSQGQNTGIGVVILPGGGYVLESIYHEGYELAKVLASQGITAAVLKYRLPNPETSDEPNMVPITDTRRALKLLRQIADSCGINKTKVGVIGFSAGSHLAAVTSLWKSSDAEENPNFSGLMYGVTNLSTANLKWIEESLYFRKLTE